jgi:hypothetical protein
VLSPHLPAAAAAHHLLRVSILFLVAGRSLAFLYPSIYLDPRQQRATLHYLPLHLASIVDLPPTLEHLLPCNVEATPVFG